MKRLALIVTASVVVLATASAGLAGPDKGKAAARKALRKVTADYVAAFNRGDAKALAAFWTPKGDYVGPRGLLIKGRDALEKKFAEFFSINQHSKLEVTITSIRLVGADVAIVDDVPELTPPLEGPPIEVRGTAVFVKRDGQWLIESARDSIHRLPSHYEQLKELEWLIGDWGDAAADGEGVSVEATCDWTVNKNYIIRRFSAELEGRDPIAGTQLIGWDARQDRIRSWVFDSDGSFSEGLWTRDGNRWIIAAAGVLPDGSEVSSTNVVTRLDDDTLTFQSTNRTTDGKPKPDLGPIEVKRKSSLADEPAGLATEPQSARETILPK